MPNNFNKLFYLILVSNPFRYKDIDDCSNLIYYCKVIILHEGWIYLPFLNSSSFRLIKKVNRFNYDPEEISVFLFKKEKRKI